MTRGFGYAVLDGDGTLADRGVRTVTGDKNKQSLESAVALIAHYQPGVLVLEDASAKDSRRSLRIRELTKQIAAAARGVKVKLYSQEKVRCAYFAEGKGTKHALAEIIASRFPEDLGLQVPPKRKPWDSEDYRMGIFDAVALALMPGILEKNRNRNGQIGKAF